MDAFRRWLCCVQGLEIIFRVGLAILQYNQTDLIQLDMEGMSQVRTCGQHTWARGLSAFSAQLWCSRQ